MFKMFKKKKKDLHKFDTQEELERYLDKLSQIIRLEGKVSECELEEIKNIPLSEWITINELEVLSKKRLGYFKRLADLQKMTKEEEWELEYKLLTKRIERIEWELEIPICTGLIRHALKKELEELKAELQVLLQKGGDKIGK